MTRVLLFRHFRRWPRMVETFQRNRALLPLLAKSTHLDGDASRSRRLRWFAIAASLAAIPLYGLIFAMLAEELNVPLSQRSVVGLLQNWPPRTRNAISIADFAAAIDFF